VVEVLVVDTVKLEPDRESDRRELSEEDSQAYTRRLRSLPVEQVIGDAMFTLVDAAQVKLGRRDARLLIDLVAVSLTHTRDYVSAELAKQIDGLLGHLRYAQVAAEGRAGQPGQVDEDNDLDRVPTPPAAPQSGAQPEQAPTTSPTSGLWVPGR
jgi:hypothetical protein